MVRDRRSSCHVGMRDTLRWQLPWLLLLALASSAQALLGRCTPVVTDRATPRARQLFAQEEWDEVLDYEAARERYERLGLMDSSGRAVGGRRSLMGPPSKAGYDEEIDTETTEEMVVRCYLAGQVLPASPLTWKRRLSRRSFRDGIWLV